VCYITAVPRSEIPEQAIENDFFMVPRSAGPDFRRQQYRIPARAAAAKPQGNHADFFVGTDDFASNPD